MIASYRRNINEKNKDGSRTNDSQPALKLKLIAKNRYEQKIQMECTASKLAHENTLAGAIALKKRLLKERKRKKREQEKVLSESDDIKGTKGAPRPKQIGPKRRSSFADSFYSNAGANIARRNAAKVCLEKMVASQEPLSDYM